MSQPETTEPDTELPSNADKKTISKHGMDQQVHFESIHDEYVRHYNSPEATQFRREFIYDFLFHSLPEGVISVADLACGAGLNSLELKKRNPLARTTGFDVSKKACRDYARLTGEPSYQLDLTLGTYDGPQYDVVMIFGGLHHCVSNLDGTCETIDRMLKPGGLLLSLEPNKECFLEPIRIIWYQIDRFFERNSEAALSVRDLDNRLGRAFAREAVAYRGGPAYFLIYNSMIFRLSDRIRELVAKPLFVIEQLYNRLPHRVFFPYFVAKWRKL